MQGLFIRDLASSGARFLVIGGKAMQALGIERDTVDVDIWVSRDEPTVESVFVTLKRFCGAPDVFRERLREPNIRVPIPSERDPEIDILTSIGDLSFDETYGAADEVAWQKLVLRVPNLDDMIRIKQVAIASTEGRIAAGEWNAAGVEEARRGIARDERDIALLRQRKV
ncbi:nucleotidyltransferase [Paraburkholderia sp. BR14263]|uniref:nucleotidyltransferase n=1 Tax=unclassified Paraburkholderia TaxID=2615204 RepID=UPI0034CDBB9D